jgi:hypothetical protein
LRKPLSFHVAGEQFLIQRGSQVNQSIQAVECEAALPAL